MTRNCVQEHLLKREHPCDCLSSWSVVSYIVRILAALSCIKQRTVLD